MLDSRFFHGKFGIAQCKQSKRWMVSTTLEKQSSRNYCRYCCNFYCVDPDLEWIYLLLLLFFGHIAPWFIRNLTSCYRALVRFVSYDSYAPLRFEYLCSILLIVSLTNSPERAAPGWQLQIVLQPQRNGDKRCLVRIPEPSLQP